jgi:hypothetical protein
MIQPRTGSDLATAEPALGLARVLAWAGREGELEAEDGRRLAAGLAFSCTVLPQPGDRVLCAGSAETGLFILGILQRPGAQAMTLVFPGETLIRAQGALSLMAEPVLTLAAPELQGVSDRTILQSRTALVSCGAVTAHGNVLQATFDSVTLAGRLCQTLVRHLIQRTRSCFRATETTDQVQAGQILAQAEGLYSVASRNTVLVSAKDTRIDGERIHMG